MGGKRKRTLDYGCHRITVGDELTPLDSYGAEMLRRLDLSPDVSYKVLNFDNLPGSSGKKGVRIRNDVGEEHVYDPGWFFED